MTNTARNVRLLVALFLMLGYLWGYSRLTAMDERFFFRSPAGLRALGLYLTGDYAAAGRAYSELLGSGTVIAAPPRPTERDARVDALVAAALRHARSGETAQSVRAMQRALWLGPPFGGSPPTFFEVMSFTGDLMDAPSRDRRLALLATTCAYLQQRDTGHGCAARAYAEEAIAKGELVPESYVTLSILLSNRGDFIESRAALGRAFAIDAQHPNALVWAAIEAGRQHDILAEHRYLWAAWTATSHDPVVGEALQQLLTKLGDEHGLNKLARDRMTERSRPARE
jgi:tetratricopeptide (TPR) repeat protein